MISRIFLYRLLHLVLRCSSFFFLFSFVLLLYLKNSCWESPNDVTTLANVGYTSYNINVAMLRLSSPPISSSNLHTASKCHFFHLKPRNKISVITDISVLGFTEISENIGGYFDKNIGNEKINKNTLKFMEILC